MIAIGIRILFLFSLIACENSESPNPNSIITDEGVVENLLETSGSENDFLYSKKQQKIQNKIFSKEPKQWIQALTYLEKELFHPEMTKESYFLSKPYLGNLRLYSQLFVKITQNDEPSMNAFFRKTMKPSLERFFGKFIAPCLDPYVTDCRFIKGPLKQENTTLPLTLHFVSNQSLLKDQISIMGAAYDTAGRGRQKKLENTYFLALLELLNSPEKNSFSTDQQRRHYDNMVNISSAIKWEIVTPEHIELMYRLKAMDYSVLQVSPLHQARKDAYSYLPRYAKADPRIYKDIVSSVSKKLAQIRKKEISLKGRPAYSQINLNQFLEKNPYSALLVIKSFLGEVNTDQNSVFLRNTESPNQSYLEIFRLSKQIILWKIAQLTLQVSKELGDNAKKMNVSSSNYASKIISLGTELSPRWNTLHSLQIPSLKNLLTDNSFLSTPKVSDQVVQFFGGINRNILKTAVYPNMIGAMSFMSKMEWSIVIKALWLTISIDTAKLYELLFTGQISGPWFDFTNLGSGGSQRKKERINLLQSESLDSFYYLFSTGIFEYYNIDSDQLISDIAEKLSKSLLSDIENTITTQNQYYFHQNGTRYKFINWCHGIKNNLAAPESLSYNELHSYLLPHSRVLKYDIMVDRDGAIQTGSSINLYYNDFYSRSTVKFKHNGISLPDMNDKMRLEMRPITHTLFELIGIVDRLTGEISHHGTSRAEQKMNDISRATQAYWGSQFEITRQLGNCSDVAVNESRRRSKEIVFSEYRYFSEIVFPLLERLESHSISLEQANAVVKAANKSHPQFLDYFVEKNKNAFYILHLPSYMVRVAQYLQDGMQLDTEILPREVSISPIVGRHLSIEIKDIDDPTNVYTSFDFKNKDTKVLSETPKEISFERLRGMNSHSFAKGAIAKLNDKFYFNERESQSHLVTSWQRSESGEYGKDDRHKIEWMTQLFQMGDIPHLNFQLQECRNYNSKTLSKDCFLIRPAIKLKDLAQESLERFKFFHHFESDLRYLELIERTTFATLENIDLQLKLFEPLAPTDVNGNGLPLSRFPGLIPGKTLAGLFDLSFKMLRSEFLGRSFHTPFSLWELNRDLAYHIRTSTKYRGTPFHNCFQTRNGCWWENEYQDAIKFYQARSLESPLFFNFDQKILENSYEFVLENIERKMNRPLSIVNSGEKVLQQLKDEGRVPEVIQFDLNLPKGKIVYLDSQLKNYSKDYEQFFETTTGGFYTSKRPDWNTYIITD